MPLLAVCHVKGVGGSTTTALGLAAVAGESSRAVLVECDPSGGDVMRRHRLAEAPSLVDLAAAVRGARSDEAVFDAASQPIRLRERRVSVVAAPPGGAQVRAALGELTRSAGLLVSAGRLVVADCGRLEAGSPVWPLLAAAHVVVVLVRGRVEELAHLDEYLGELVGLGAGRLVMVALRAGGPYPAGEVASVLADRLVGEFAVAPSVVRVTGPLPQDRRAAAVLAGDWLPGRRWQRLPLLVSLQRLLGEVSPYLAAVQVPAVRPLWGTR